MEEINPTYQSLPIVTIFENKGGYLKKFLQILE